MQRLLLGAWLLLAGCSESGTDLLHSADELLFTKQYAEAARVYEAVALEADDTTAEGVALRAAALLKLGDLCRHFFDDPKRAVSLYRRVTELTPGSHEAFTARMSMVRILADRLNEPATAVTELASLIEAFPNEPSLPSLRLELAHLAFRATKYAQALGQAERLVAGPDRALRVEAGLLMASIHRLEGRSDLALERYRSVLGEELEAAVRGQTRFELARCLEEVGRLEEAIAAYRLAETEQVDKDLVAARVIRAKARLMGKKGSPRTSSIRF